MESTVSRCVSALKKPKELGTLRHVPFGLRIRRVQSEDHLGLPCRIHEGDGGIKPVGF